MASGHLVADRDPALGRDVDLDHLQHTLRQLIAGLAWLPFISLGFIAAGPLRDRLDRDQTRQRVLVFAAVAGITVLIRALVKLLG